MVNTFQNYINGAWVDATSKKTFLSLNPTNEQVLGKFQQGSAKDVETAITAAEQAYPAWSDLPAPHRADMLFEVVQLLKKNKERLARVVTTEMGKVIKEGRGDVQEAIDAFEYMAGEGRRLFGNTTPSELQHKFCATIRRPFGVVGLITPWNFPMAIPAWKIAPALVCGNTIVFKPSSDTPLCAIELVKLLIEAGVPKGVLNLITGSGEEVGSTLIKHPKVRAISFTGSRDTGEYILKNAGIKKVGLELGGKNAIIIMEDADLDLALDGVIWAGFGTTGQRCTAASRIILHKAIQKEFEEKLIRKTEKLKVGNGLNETTDIGPLIAKRAVEKTHMYTNIGRKEGAKVIYGGAPLKGKGFFYAPTIFSNVKGNMRIAQEEIFGPTIALFEAKDLTEAIEICNGVKYGLSTSIYTQQINQAFKGIEKIESGITYVNAPTIGAEFHLPFGGIKQTGNGTREGGINGIEEFSEIKTIYIDYSGKLQKAQMDTYKD